MSTRPLSAPPRLSLARLADRHASIFSNLTMHCLAQVVRGEVSLINNFLLESTAGVKALEAVGGAGGGGGEPLGNGRATPAERGSVPD